jgi:hypothetical protein
MHLCSEASYCVGGVEEKNNSDSAEEDEEEEEEGGRDFLATVNTDVDVCYRDSIEKRSQDFRSQVGLIQYL